MPYDADNIDHVCTDCGRVVSGPHKDETVQKSDRKMIGVVFTLWVGSVLLCGMVAPVVGVYRFLRRRQTPKGS